MVITGIFTLMILSPISCSQNYLCFQVTQTRVQAWTCWALPPKQTQVGVIGFWNSLLQVPELISPILGLSRSSVSAQEETGCWQENGMNPYVCASPRAEHIHNPTNAASLCSWLLRKVALVLRRSAGRISPSWRRRLKPLTSSGRRRNPQRQPGRMINLRNLCECFHFFLASPSPPSSIAFPILQRSVPASRLQRFRAAKKNRGAETEGLGREEKRAGWETRNGYRCQKVWRRGGGCPEEGLRSPVDISLVFHWWCCSGVSHSVTSDMHIIQQENPYKSKKGRRLAGDDEDDGSITSRSVWERVLIIPGRVWAQFLANWWTLTIS